MATQHRITVESTMTFNEGEIRALEALAGYGADSFLRVFYQQLGKAYLAPHEHGLRTLFAKIDAECKPAVATCDRARKALEPPDA